MTAIVLRGAQKGQPVEIHQWCNDWFTAKNSPKPFSPSSLAFTGNDLRRILASETGVLLGRFKIVTVDLASHPGHGFTFRRMRR